MKELQKDSYVDERGLIAPWPRQSGGGMTSGAAARPAGTAKGPAQVLAQTRQQLAQAREHGHPEDCIRIVECKVTKEEAEMNPWARGWTRREPDFVELSTRARRRKKPCWRPRTSSKRSRR